MIGSLCFLSALAGFVLGVWFAKTVFAAHFKNKLALRLKHEAQCELRDKIERENPIAHDAMCRAGT